jgi:hypothetical protein
MKTPARPSPGVLRQAALVALSVMAIIIVPVVARAACHAETHPIVFHGPQQPVVLAAHSFAGAFQAPHAHGRRARVHQHSWDERRFRWSLRDGEFHSSCGVSAEDLRDVIGAPGGHGSLLWISQDGEEWVIRDRSLIQRARGSVEPMERLGAEMGRLGGEMGRLGAQQGRFGAELGRLGARQGVLAARLALLELREDDDDPAIEREAAAIEREMDDLSRRQDEFDRRQDSSLESRMDDLGEQMEELGHRMEQLSQRAERELKALVKEAIASRKAERAGHLGDL